MKILIYLCTLVKFLVRVKFLWTEWRHKEGFDIGRKKKLARKNASKSISEKRNWNRVVKYEKTFSGGHVITGKLGQSEEGAGVLELCRGQFFWDTLGRCAHRAGSVPPPDVDLEIWATTQNLWGKASCPPFYTTQELRAVCLLASSYNELVCCLNAQLSAGPLTPACPVPGQTFWGWRPAANTNHHNRETDKWQREKEIAWYCSAASVYTRSARVLLDLLPKSLISTAEQNLLEGDKGRRHSDWKHEHQSYI